MLRTALVFAMAASFLAPRTLHAQTQCPPNYVGSFLTSPSGTPIYAAMHRDSMCSVPNDCRWKSTWDLTTGQASCDASTACFGEIPDPGNVGQFTADDYVLHGPSSPTPITFVVQMHVSGSSSQGCTVDCSSGFCVPVCSYGSLSAYLKEGSQTQSASGTASLNTDLQLTLSKNVGEDFRLDMKLQAGAACNAGDHITYNLTFFLPPGYGLTSCYGFSMPAPTAVERASWGRLKTIYR